MHTSEPLPAIDVSHLTDDALWEQLRDKLGAEHDWTALLATGANARHIRSLLAKTLRDVQGQLASRSADMEVLQQECFAMGQPGKARWFRAAAEHQEWRAAALHFLRLMEKRQAEARRAYDRWRHDNHASTEEGKDADLRTLVRVLAQGIAAHQQGCAQEDLEPSVADLKLWSLLDILDLPVGAGRVTLARMVEQFWI